MRSTILRLLRFSYRSAAALLVSGVLAGPGAAGEVRLDYRLKWLYNTSVVGDLYARDAGFFRRAGLEVNVKAGGPERDAIKELELGHADFGVASADQVVRALSKGSPVVVLAQLFQVNPLQWIYRAEIGPIRRPADLRDRTIGITYGGNDETIMRTLLAGAGLTDDQVRLFSVRYDYTPFYRRRVDLWPVYRNSQGIVVADKLRQAGEEVAFFRPEDHGVDFVANSVVTSREMVRRRPEIVAAFRQALLAGWRAALDPANHDAAIETVARRNTEASREVIDRQLAITRRLVRPDPQRAIGTIDTAAWRQTESIMRAQGLIPAPVHVENALLPLP